MKGERWSFRSPFVLASALALQGPAPPLGRSLSDGSTPSWLERASVFVSGESTSDDCRSAVCRHNENCDLIRFRGRIFLVHRTAKSQILGPNSSLRVYRSDDEGITFHHVTTIPAPADRDLRDPHFYLAGDELWLKALTRRPVLSLRDAGVDTITVAYSSRDGSTFSSATPLSTRGWSFWRVRPYRGRYYAAAYRDGDVEVRLFSSEDGRTWARGASIFANAADSPLETELVFLDSGTLLALVRTDGALGELLGSAGHLRTRVCLATPPYERFACPTLLEGQRLDGPVAFHWQKRVFVLARKHLPPSGWKRTSLFELVGDLEAGDVRIRELGVLPSAGDTAYAGIVALDARRVLTAWYSSDIHEDPSWVAGMLGPTDIWTGVIDLGKAP